MQARGGLAGMYAKVVGGGLHEGGWLYYMYIFFYFWEGGGFREILSKEQGGGLHEGVR